MAQHIGYFQNNVAYLEGPFVCVCIMGYRIEVELKQHSCPVLCDPSIYALLELHGLQAHKTNDREKIIQSVDWLNQQVKEGNIICNDYGVWVAK